MLCDTITHLHKAKQIVLSGTLHNMNYVYLLGFNLTAITKEPDIKKQPLATEATERTEFFGISLQAVARQSDEYHAIAQNDKKACSQNLFFSVCSVTSVANNNVSQHGGMHHSFARSSLNQYKLCYINMVAWP